MSSSLLPKQQVLTTPSGVSSFTSLLERGLQCAQQGHYSEAASLFALAREHLSPEQHYVAVAIDAFLESHERYWQAQQALHLASKHFVEAETQQQTQLLALNKLLSTPIEDSFPETVQPVKSSQDHESGLELAELLSINPNRQHTSRSLQLLPEEADALPALHVTCFGHFEVKRFDQPIALCQNRSGQTILRYLVAQSSHSASIDTLMEILWPEDTSEVARRKLQIAVSAIRRALNKGYSNDQGGGYILCKDQLYLLNPSVTIRTDVDEFLSLWRSGRQTNGSQAALYEKACHLYTDAFLLEDLYADWSFTRREQLNQIYLNMCHTLADHCLETRSYEDAAKWINSILKENRCDEEAHRQLIRIYAAEGRRSEALRQYYLCERILAKDLGVPPMPETVNVFHAILTSENFPAMEAKIERK